METSRLLPPGREDLTVRDVVRLPVTALLLACQSPRFKRLTGWLGLAHCPGDAGAWTCRLRARAGVFGWRPEAVAEQPGAIRVDYALHYFPRPDEPVGDQFSLAAGLAAQAADFDTAIRDFPASPALCARFRLGRTSLCLTRDRRRLVLDLAALDHDIIRLPAGLATADGWVVPPGEAEQDLPAWSLARELHDVVAGALTFGLGLPPGPPRPSHGPGRERLRLADGRLVETVSPTARLCRERLVWGTDSPEAAPDRDPNNDRRLAWERCGALPAATVARPCFQAHALDTAVFPGQAPAPGHGHRPDLIILTGFLGAGKTSLLLELLEYHRAHDQFLGIIQNEIGAADVDGLLIDGGETALSLDAGCVCCTLAGSLASGLRRLRDRFQPERIILETTGLANPLNLLAQQEAWADLARLEMVVTVVDAVHGESLCDGSDIARDQVRCADVLVVNKCDLVADTALETLRARLRRLNSRAPLLATSQGRIPAGLLCDAGADRHTAPRAGAGTSLLRRRNHADEAFAAVRLDQPAGLTLAGLRRGLDRLPEAVFRIKGVLRLADVPEAQLLQGVGRRIEVSPLERPFAAAPFLVCIGRDLDAAALEALFAS